METDFDVPTWLKFPSWWFEYVWITHFQTTKSSKPPWKMCDRSSSTATCGTCHHDQSTMSWRCFHWSFPEKLHPTSYNNYLHNVHMMLFLVFLCIRHTITFNSAFNAELLGIITKGNAHQSNQQANVATHPRSESHIGKNFEPKQRITIGILSRKNCMFNSLPIHVVICMFFFWKTHDDNPLCQTAVASLLFCGIVNRRLQTQTYQSTITW